MANSIESSSSPEQRGEGRRRGMGTDPRHVQMINKLSNAVLERLANSDPYKTLTADHVDRIKQYLSEVYPVYCAPDHPTYSVMIQTAVVALNNKRGLTQEAISKYIREQYDCLPLAHEGLLSYHLKKLSESGVIVSVSKNCYILPGAESASVSPTGRVQKQKRRGGMGRGRRTGNGIEQKKIGGEQQFEVTDQQKEHGHQCPEPSRDDQHSNVFNDEFGLTEKQQDRVNGGNSKEQIEETAVIVEEHNNLDRTYNTTDEQVEVTAQEREDGQQNQELNEEEQYREVIDNQNTCLEQQVQQQGEVNGQQCQTQMQEVALNDENAKEKNEEIEEEVEVTVKYRLHGQQILEPILREQHSKVIDVHSGSPDEQLDEVNGQQGKSQIEEVAVIVEKQRGSEEKYKSTEEQVEVSEQQRECEQQSQEVILQEQHNGVIDSHNESADAPQEVSRQRSQAQRQAQRTAESEVLLQERDAATSYNSSPSLASQKLPHHGSSPSPEKSYVELLTRTREVKEKLMENLSVIRRETSNYNTQKPIWGPLERPLPEREYTFCGLSAQQTRKLETSAQNKSCQMSLILPIESLPLEKGITKCQNKSMKKGVVVELTQKQEIGNSKGSLELLKVGQFNSGEVSRDVEKRSCLNIEENLDKDTYLEVDNSSARPNLLSQQEPSVTLLDTSCQDVSMHSPEHELQTNRKNQQPDYHIPERLRDVKLLSIEGGHETQEYEPNSNSSQDRFEESQGLDLEDRIHAKCEDLKQRMPLFGQENQRAVLSGVVKEPGDQVAKDEKQHAETVREENADIEFTESQQSCEKQQKQEQHQQRQLCTHRKKPSESDRGVPEAHQFQQVELEQPSKNQVEERPIEHGTETLYQFCQVQYQMLEQQQQRQLKGRGRKPHNQKGGQEWQTEKLTEQSCPRWHKKRKQGQLPNPQEAEISQEIKTSLAKTNQPQLQRQLRPRGHKLSESGQAATESRAVFSPSQSLDQQYPLLSKSRKSKKENPVVGDSSQLNNPHENHYNQSKRCTMQPSLTGQNIELANHETSQDPGSTADDLSPPMEQKMNPQGPQKKLKFKPIVTEVLDGLVVTSQRLVAGTQIAETPPQFNPAAGIDFSPTIKELQRLRHMKLRSHSQVVSQSNPAVSITESLPSKEQSDQPLEKKHNDKLTKQKNPPTPKGNADRALAISFSSANQLPRKRGRGRSPMAKLAMAGISDASPPDKCKKQQQPKNRKTREAL